MTEKIIIAVIGAGPPTLMALAAWYSARKTRATVKEEAENQRVFTDASVRALNGTASCMIQSYHRPMWIKLAKTDDEGNTRFIMQELNDNYEKKYSVRRIDYIGKTDCQVTHMVNGVHVRRWTADECQRLYQHDSAVYSSGRPQFFSEELDGKKRWFVKLRLTSPNGESKGVWGYEVHEAEVKEMFKSADVS